MTLAVHTAAFALGVLLLVASGASALRSTVLPGPDTPVLSMVVLRQLQRLLARSARRADPESSWLGSLIPPLHLVASLTLWLSGIMAGSVLLLVGTGQAPLGKLGDLVGEGMIRLLSGTEHAPSAVTAIQFTEIAVGAFVASAVLAVLPAWQRRHRRRDRVVADIAWRTKGTFSGISLAGVLASAQTRAEQQAMWREWADWLEDLRHSHATTPTLAWLESPTGGPGAWVDAVAAVVEAAELLAHHDLGRSAPETAALECYESGVRCLRQLTAVIAGVRHRQPSGTAAARTRWSPASPWRADAAALRRAVLLVPWAVREDAAA